MMNRNNALGFSMIELMIAMAIGLVVIGSVLAFTLSSLTTNTEYVQATRLSQELRNSMDFISRELRRAGYDQNVGGSVARYTVGNVTPSPFGRILVTNNGNTDCVIYAYDRTDNGVGTAGVVDLDNGEIRALRLATRNVDGLNVGVLEVAESSNAAPTCNGASPNYTNYPPTCNGGWCALSDPRVLNLTAFNLVTTGYITQPGSATSVPVTMREIGVELQGQLRRSEDGTVTRGIRSNVKVRADCLETSANCALAPTGT